MCALLDGALRGPICPYMHLWHAQTFLNYTGGASRGLHFYNYRSHTHTERKLFPLTWMANLL